MIILWYYFFMFTVLTIFTFSTILYTHYFSHRVKVIKFFLFDFSYFRNNNCLFYGKTINVFIIKDKLELIVSLLLHLT